MPRIRPLDIHEVSDPVRAEWDRQIQAHGRMTNMKRTLAHSHVALRALMEWYDLRDAVTPFLGERLTHLYSHAISSATDCLVCSTFFRRLLIEAGEDPDTLALDERERLVVAFGQELARDAHGVSDDLYEALGRHFSPDQIVTLTAFGALMLATNVFNNTLRVDLDGYLEPFRAPATSPPPQAGREELA